MRAWGRSVEGIILIINDSTTYDSRAMPQREKRCDDYSNWAEVSSKEVHHLARVGDGRNTAAVAKTEFL